MVGISEINSILRDLYAGSRLDVAWLPQEPQHRACVRLAFLGLLCMETGMPYGGRIEIDQVEGKWSLTGTADKVNVDADLWSALAQMTTDQSLQPAQVQFGLMPVVAAEDGRRVFTQSDAGSVQISF